MRVMFYFFLTTILLLEGLGIPKGRETAFFFILIAPFFLFLVGTLHNKKIVLPTKATLFSVLFLLFSLFSVLHSRDQERSIEQVVYNIALFCIFIFVFNAKEKMKGYVTFLIYFCSFLFSIYSLVLGSVKGIFPFLIPETGYQFVFSRFGSHNHLGDFLILPVCMSLHYLFNKKHIRFSFFSFLFFLPFLIFSFSRSAYSTLIITSIFFVVLSIQHKVQRNRSAIILTISSILLLTFFFFSTISESRGVVFISETHTVLQKELDLRYKSFIAGRDMFFADGVSALKENMLFGVGPGNYIYISGAYSELPQSFTYSSHNIFLDSLTEYGMLAGIAFILFIFSVFLFAEKGLLILPLVAMVINFQTDYTHTIFSYFLLFFVLMGIALKRESVIEKSYMHYVMIVLSCIPFAYFQYLMFH